MKYLIRVVAALIISCIAASLCGAKEAEFIPLSKRDLGKIKTYQVNKLVKDFPEKEDLSTPESAYATINRISANGDDGGWRRVVPKAHQGDFPPENTPRQAVDPKRAEMFLGAKIIEVLAWRGDLAMVCAEMVRDGKTHIDSRSFKLEDGKWLNDGNGYNEDMAGARQRFDRLCRIQLFERDYRPHRTKVDDPAAHLRPYVDFLRANAKEPREFVLDALKTHKLVIMGEAHNRPIQWQFNSSLAAHPDFARNVGTIYMELSFENQPLVDKFLASPGGDPEPIVDVLRDFGSQAEGWPSQAWLDFFKTVWLVNRSLPQDQRIRIVLVDRESPWRHLKPGDGVNEYYRYRDERMAENLLADMEKDSADKRHAMFIVGYGHGMLNFETTAGGPEMSSAWHLREKLGAENVLSILPHAPILRNTGGIFGRRALGLFDSAFAEFDNKPTAFTLAEGPFGTLFYDNPPDEAFASRYCDGYSAYLYLGPLEYEIFSPIIANFYTQEFVQEVDRRMKAAYGKGWTESRHTELTPESMIRSMSSTWGMPRDWVFELGPIDAWRYGDDWQSIVKKEQTEYAKAHPEAIVKAAQRLLGAIREKDYSQPFGGGWQNWLSGSTDYTVKSDFPGWIEWMYKTFRDNPIASVEVGQSVSYSQWGMPIVEYKVTLKDGTLLAGKLPMVYDALTQVWGGLTGLDWHLRK